MSFNKPYRITTEKFLEYAKKYTDETGKTDYSKFLKVGTNFRVSNGMQWESMQFSKNDGLTWNSFVVKFTRELMSGRIAPNTEDELAKVNAVIKGDYKLKLRKYSPAITITKYPSFETDDNGDPKGPLPPDSEISLVFRVIEHIDTCFCDTMEAFIASGKIVKKNPRKEPPEGAIVVVNDSIKTLIQRRISDRAPKNANKALINQITRLPIKFDQKTGACLCDIYQVVGTTIKDGKTVDERVEMTVGEDNERITAENVHNIPSRSLNDGFLRFPVCLSGMGISVPMGLKVLIVRPPVKTNLGIDDFDGDDSDDENDNEAEAPVEKDNNDNNDNEKVVEQPIEITEDDLDALMQ